VRQKINFIDLFPCLHFRGRKVKEILGSKTIISVKVVLNEIKTMMYAILSECVWHSGKLYRPFLYLPYDVIIKKSVGYWRLFYRKTPAKHALVNESK